MNTLFFFLSIFLRLRFALLETEKMLTSIVALSFLALLASAENKKLSNHATALADNSANLAFRYFQNCAYAYSNLKDFT